MLTEPAVNRAVMGAISAPSDASGDVSPRSSAFGPRRPGSGVDSPTATRRLALAVLPDQLAVVFRGVVSFWTAGEVSDQMLRLCAGAAAATVLLGFAGRDDRAELFALRERWRRRPSLELARAP